MTAFEFVICEMFVIIITVASCLTYGMSGQDKSGSATNIVFCVVTILLALVCTGVAGMEDGTVALNVTAVAIQLVRMVESVKELLKD